jgi:phospholipase C
MVISPYAKRGFVNHQPQETASILRFLEKRWSLQTLGMRDAAASDMTSNLDFARSP